MKKLLVPLFALAFLFLAGCGSSDDPSSAHPDIPASESTDQILSAGKNIVIKEIRQDKHTKYSYTVTADDGTVLENAFCSEQPHVAIINADMLGIRFTHDGHMFCRYFDHAKKLVSDSFRDAFWDNGKLVAYHDYDNGHRMVVRDIFDDDAYYYEKQVECVSWLLTVTDVKEQNGSIVVYYIEGTDASAKISTYTTTLPIK